MLPQVSSGVVPSELIQAHSGFLIVLPGAQVGSVVSYPLSAVLCVYGFDGGWPSVFYVFGKLDKDTNLYVLEMLILRISISNMLGFLSFFGYTYIGFSKKFFWGMGNSCFIPNLTAEIFQGHPLPHSIKPMQVWKSNTGFFGGCNAKSWVLICTFQWLASLQVSCSICKDEVGYWNLSLSIVSTIQS